MYYSVFKKNLQFVKKITISLVVLFASCDNSKDQSEPLKFKIPEETQEYVDSFILEASNRNVFIERKNLIIVLSDEPIITNQQNSCGITQGPITGEKQNYIQIDTQCLAWRHSDFSREVLLFHELAHALLVRDHDNNLLPNNEWKSIMVGTNWSIDDFYIFDFTKRAYYIDELFDPSISSPDWAN